MARGALPDSGRDTAAGVNRCPGCGQYCGNEYGCPTPTGPPEGDYPGLKGDVRVKAMVADLEAAVQAIVESGQLHSWLDAMASNGLNRWSANSRLLAAVQILQRGESLDGLHLMGSGSGRSCTARSPGGAKAVWILGPHTRKPVEEAVNGTNTEGQRAVGFMSRR